MHDTLNINPEIAEDRRSASFKEHSMNPAIRFVMQSIMIIESWLQPAVLLVVRVFIAWAFFKSGLLKLDDWQSTLFLFEYEYVLPLVPHELAALLATAGELILPVLLALGLGGRIGALGLLAMTLVIELFVYPNTQEHYYWMSILGLLAVTGPGALSADAWIRRRLSAN